MNLRFDDKHVLVTGGARGIGFEIARQFAAAGAQVTIFDNNAEDLAKLPGALPGALGVQVDVSDAGSVAAGVEQAEGRAPVDVLINNAGIASETPFLRIEEREWRRILDVNLTGMFLVAQAVARQMARRRQGSIVNMASKNGLDGEIGYAHYNASKGGVVMLTQTMALELATLGIRVNAVCPGYIQTPMSMEIDDPAFVADFVNRYIPMGRTGTVQDVAPAFLFLASDGARFITGQTLVIDGGQLAGQKPSAELLKRFV